MNQVCSYSAAGTFGKAIPYRILPGTDFLAGIREVCLQHGIRHGVLVGATGSLQRVTFKVAAPSDNKIGSAYSDPIVKTGPIEILSVQGVILEDEGKTDFHIHGSFCDKDSTVFGGHVVEGANPALTTIEGVVAEVIGVALGRRYDDRVEARMFHPMSQ